VAPGQHLGSAHRHSHQGTKTTMRSLGSTRMRRNQKSRKLTTRWLANGTRTKTRTIPLPSSSSKQSPSRTRCAQHHAPTPSVCRVPMRSGCAPSRCSNLSHSSCADALVVRAVGLSWAVGGACRYCPTLRSGTSTTSAARPASTRRRPPARLTCSARACSTLSNRSRHGAGQFCSRQLLVAYVPAPQLPGPAPGCKQQGTVVLITAVQCKMLLCCRDCRVLAVAGSCRQAARSRPWPARCRHVRQCGARRFNSDQRARACARACARVSPRVRTCLRCRVGM
jgi:hypothetical protein